MRPLTIESIPGPDVPAPSQKKRREHGRSGRACQIGRWIPAQVADSRLQPKIDINILNNLWMNREMIMRQSVRNDDRSTEMATVPDETASGSPTSTDSLEYLADLVTELKSLAHASRLENLSAILSLAEAEMANQIAARRKEALRP